MRSCPQCPRKGVRVGLGFGGPTGTRARQDILALQIVVVLWRVSSLRAVASWSGGVLAFAVRSCPKGRMPWLGTQDSTHGGRTKKTQARCTNNSMRKGKGALWLRASTLACAPSGAWMWSLFCCAAAEPGWVDRGGGERMALLTVASLFKGWIPFGRFFGPTSSCAGICVVGWSPLAPCGKRVGVGVERMEEAADLAMPNLKELQRDSFWRGPPQRGAAASSTPGYLPYK